MFLIHLEQLLYEYVDIVGGFLIIVALCMMWLSLCWGIKILRRKEATK